MLLLGILGMLSCLILYMSLLYVCYVLGHVRAGRISLQGPKNHSSTLERL